MRRLIVTAHAKINLYLGVGERAVDGYHRVRTLLAATSLHDTLIVEQNEMPFSLKTSSSRPRFMDTLSLPPQENLVYKAAMAMQAACGRPANVEVRLEKAIPAGAGLGGGSADAAGVIAALAHLWRMSQTSEICLDVARSLGADVPFFLYGGIALMEGRGDEVASTFEVPNAWVVLVKDEQPVSTPAAYRTFDEKPVSPAPIDPVLEAIRSGDLSRAGGVWPNNLTEAACIVQPALRDLLQEAASYRDTLGSALSGSGSAVFILCDNEKQARELCQASREAGHWSHCASLAKRGVTITER